MDPKAQTEHTRFAYAVRDLSIASVELHHTLAARIGITPQDLAALTHLGRDGPLTPQQLCERLNLRKPSVTSLINRLEGRGHARRTANTADHRSTLVEITEDGYRESLAALTPVIDAISRVSAELSEDEHAIATRVIEQCTAAITADVAST